MRWIDKWAGVPLCFIFTVCSRLGRIFRHKQKGSVPQKILFIELSEMGSIVLAYSLFKKTRDLYPEAELFFLTFADNRYALDLLKVIPEDKVLTIQAHSGFRFILTSLKAILDMRRLRIDTVLDMELFARISALLSYLSGAGTRIGYYRYHNEGLYRGELLTHKVAYNPHIHMAHNLLDLIAALRAIPEQPLPKRQVREKDLILPRYKASEEEKRRVAAKLDLGEETEYRQTKIILLNPNASDLIPLRKWPLENYIQLAHRLLENPRIRIVLTGTAAEKAKAEEIKKTLASPRCLNLAGQTTFSELLTLYTLADILVTNDSGPVHFSAMTDIHTLALFGPETPKLYGPLGKNHHVYYADYACSPCVSAYNHRKSPCRNNLCLQAITVDEVFAGIQRILSVE